MEVRGEGEEFTKIASARDAKQENLIAYQIEADLQINLPLKNNLKRFKGFFWGLRCFFGFPIFFPYGMFLLFRTFKNVSIRSIIKSIIV